MLEVKDLHKFYGSFHAVKGISFDVQPGEVVGFLGPNGAGKTTTMKIIVGFMSMSSGEVQVAGHSVATDSLAVREAIGYLPEHAPLYEDMTVTECLKFVASMRGLSSSFRKERLQHVIGVCNLGPKRRALVKTLSKGYRQRVGLAQAIMHDPKLVILDEPTAGLDPNQIIDIRELLREIGQRNTVILSSHILSEVEATCGRVLIAADGRIVAEGSPATLERDHTDRLEWNLVVSGLGESAESELRDTVATWDGVELDSVTTAAGRDLRARLLVLKDQSFQAELSTFVSARGGIIEELEARRPTLEDVFKELTSSERLGRSEPPAAVVTEQKGELS